MNFMEIEKEVIIKEAMTKDITRKEKRRKEIIKDMNYTYIVKCSDGSLYTGWTNNLEKRIKDHNAGRGAKYTKARRPVVLVYKEEFPTKQEAMKREWEIKRLSRKEKLSMIENSKS